MRDAGVPVGLGGDGSASNDRGNMVDEARQEMVLQRVANGADAMSACEALEIATRGRAEVLGRDVRDGRIATLDAERLTRQADAAVRRLIG